jgi:vacuolar-type H+-ATPase subunit E/Vma4
MYTKYAILLWKGGMVNKEIKQQAQEEYERVEQQAWEEYKRSRQQAWEEYERVEKG